MFVPAEQAIAGMRFSVTDRAPSGDIVFVEIDASSLAAVGIWPWPRSVHGNLLDKLMDAGADEVVFDVDFSAASNEKEDAAFAEALDRAGGYAFLAAFRQLSGTQIVWSHPLALFARYASVVLVNVEANASGQLSRVPAALNYDGTIIPSIALTLGRPAQQQPQTIELDFGIDLSQIHRVSAIDVINEQVDPALLSGKQIVVGASALELRDFFPVARFGIIPGPMAQIAAAETVKAGRALHGLDLVPGGIIGALLALIVLLRGAAWSPHRHAVMAFAMALSVELCAWFALREWAITFSTLPIHATLASFVTVAFLDERGVRYRQHQRVRAQRAVMQQMLSQVVTDSFDGILVINQHGIIVAASDAAGAILGRPGSLLDRPLSTVMPNELLEWIEQGLVGVHECACRIGQSQRIIETVATRSMVPDPEGAAADREVLCITFKDITEKRQQAEQLSYLASHDALTGALSRYALEEQIGGQLLASGQATTVLVRMERLRSVSATLGHDFADSVLCEVQERLESTMGAGVGRLGTDLFAFNLPRLLSQSELEAELGRISAILEAPYELDDHAVVLGVRYGVSSTRTAPPEAPQLLQQAEIALRSATQGGNNIALYASADGEKMRARQALDIAMRRALRLQEFYLLYQPQIDLASGAMVGVEALVRWRDADLGMVPPADFIPLAEETGLIISLGEWVLREACREAAQWNWSGRLSVNVSAVQFKLADIVGLVEDATRQSGFPADRLDIEITESLYAGNDTVILAALERLQAIGCKIAIDDFGTGYSSLSYLSRFPIDVLKIDRSFVSDISRDASDAAIVASIITLAHNLKMSVIAEGVETAEQLDYLRRHGCDEMQGYYFSRPLAAPDFEQMLRQRVCLPPVPNSGTSLVA